MVKYIDKGTALQHLTDRLMESALNNVGIKADADEVFRDIAENRLPVWIDELPAAEVQEVKHGRWLAFFPLRNMFSCSICGQWGDRLWNYCPNCGARCEEV